MTEQNTLVQHYNPIWISGNLTLPKPSICQKWQQIQFRMMKQLQMMAQCRECKSTIIQNSVLEREITSWKGDQATQIPSFSTKTETFYYDPAINIDTCQLQHIQNPQKYWDKNWNQINCNILPQFQGSLWMQRILIKIGGGFDLNLKWSQSTVKLKESMTNPEKDGWTKLVQKKCQRMVDNILSQAIDTNKFNAKGMCPNMSMWTKK